MPIVLAFASALVYGVADYCGGRATRAHPAALVTMLGQAVSLVLVVIAVLVVGTSLPGASSLWWGALGGAAGAVGLSSLYYALANGSMTVVAPVSAVVGAALPVVVGLSLGERPRPIAYAGIAVAVIAVALVSGAIGHHDRPTPRRIVGFAVLAGLGFGVLFVALDRADSSSGLWPLVAARCASVPLLVLLCWRMRARVGTPRSTLRYAVIAGVLDMGANGLYLEATRGGLLSVVAVIGSLYPASTVLLAFLIDRERVNRWQSSGLAMAGLALVLVTLGRG